MIQQKREKFAKPCGFPWRNTVQKSFEFRQCKAIKNELDCSNREGTEAFHLSAWGEWWPQNVCQLSLLHHPTPPRLGKGTAMVGSREASPEPAQTQWPWTWTVLSLELCWFLCGLSTQFWDLGAFWRSSWTGRPIGSGLTSWLPSKWTTESRVFKS